MAFEIGKRTNSNVNRFMCEEIKMSGFKEVILSPDVVVYNADCREVLPVLGQFDALVTDPPYGIGEAKGKNKSRGNLAKSIDYGVDDWDDKNKMPIDELMDAVAKSDHQIIFGGQFYNLPPTSCLLIWDKQNGMNDFADCEVAWTNLQSANRIIKHQWNGMLRKGGEERCGHPTQKPVDVMGWVIAQLPDEVETIIDPFMGSGTTGIAAVRAGKKFIGIEQNDKYFGLAVERISKELDAPRLFNAVTYPETKKCQGCGVVYKVEVGVTFNKKEKSKDGLQPYCRRCDQKYKNNATNGWRNFSRELTNNHPECVGKWTKEKYLELMGQFKCTTCGANVSDWGDGYWVDRISNNRGYTPDNCRPSCKPCNFTKSNSNPEVSIPLIKGYVDRYGLGKVPWDQISPKFVHVDSRLPDLSAYIVEEQESLFARVVF